MRMHFEKLSRFDRKLEYNKVAIPFGEGKLLDEKVALVVNADRKVFPTQCMATAKWADGSVKWLLVKSLVDLPGNKAQDYFLDISGKIDKPTMHEIDISYGLTGNMIINNNCLNIELKNSGEEGIFERIEFDKTIYISDNFSAFSATNETGEKFNAKLVSEWSVLENGVVEAVLEAKAKHMNQIGNEYLDAYVTLHIFANKPYIYLDYRIINLSNSSDDKKLNIKGLDFYIKPNERTIRKAIGISNYKTDITEGDNLYNLIDADTIFYTANEHLPETFFGTFWADYNTKNSGIAVTIFQAQQNFPKAFMVNKNGISTQLIPEECEFSLKLSRGMAKSHTIMIHFHKEDTTLDDVNIRSLQFQMPDIALLESEAYNCGVFENIFPVKKAPHVEQGLIYMADIRGRAYGMMHWGDAYDENYTKQGRGNGRLIWLNNEYDFPHAAMQMYVMSGERRFLDYCNVGVKHWIDIDVCHLSNDLLRHGAQIVHSADHVSGYVEISHEWVEGIFDYYHQTGDKFAYETAIAIGENILYHLSQPKYQGDGEINARETGWAMRALVALYKETNNEKYILEADKILVHFRRWKERFGAFLAPYTDHTAIRVPFMIAIAVGSLMRYYEARESEEAKLLIIQAVDDMIENCMLDCGTFYYKELPSLRRLGSNTLILEALVDAYLLTGDRRYMDIGRDNFQQMISTNITRNSNNKTKLEDAVIMDGVSPKNFAQGFFPLTRYYVEAMKIYGSI